jgi:hypothetical protein
MICEGTVIVVELLPLESNYYFSKEVPKHHAMEVKESFAVPSLSAKLTMTYGSFKFWPILQLR